MTEQEYINISDLRYAQIALHAVSEIKPGNSVLDLDELNQVRKQLSSWVNTLFSFANVDSPKSGESPATDTQQLKAEICAFVTEINKAKSAYDTDSIAAKYCNKWRKHTRKSANRRKQRRYICSEEN